MSREVPWKNKREIKTFSNTYFVQIHHQQTCPAKKKKKILQRGGNDTDHKLRISIKPSTGELNGNKIYFSFLIDVKELFKLTATIY